MKKEKLTQKGHFCSVTVQHILHAKHSDRAENVIVGIIARSPCPSGYILMEDTVVNQVLCQVYYYELLQMRRTIFPLTHHMCSY